MNKLQKIEFMFSRWFWRRASEPLDIDLKYIVGFCEQTSKSWPWLSKKGASEPLDIDLQSIVGCCEQSSKS